MSTLCLVVGRIGKNSKPERRSLPPSGISILREIAVFPRLLTLKGNRNGAENQLKYRRLSGHLTVTPLYGPDGEFLGINLRKEMKTLVAAGSIDLLWWFSSASHAPYPTKDELVVLTYCVYDDSGIVLTIRCGVIHIFNALPQIRSAWRRPLETKQPHWWWTVWIAIESKIVWRSLSA